MDCGETLIAAVGVAAGAILGSLAALIKADAARKRAEAELVLAKAEAEKRAEEVVKRLGLRAPPRLSPVSKRTPGARGGTTGFPLEVLTNAELLDEWLAGRLNYGDG